MKKKLFVALLLLAISTMGVHAATTLFWDVNGITTPCGGTGNWGTNTTSPAFWTTTCDTAPFSVWNNANLDSATFSAASTPTITNNITINKLTWTVASSTLTIAGATTMTFSGAGAGVDSPSLGNVAL